MHKNYHLVLVKGQLHVPRLLDKGSGSAILDQIGANCWINVGSSWDHTWIKLTRIHYPLVIIVASLFGQSPLQTKRIDGHTCGVCFYRIGSKQAMEFTKNSLIAYAIASLMFRPLSDQRFLKFLFPDHFKAHQCTSSHFNALEDFFKIAQSIANHNYLQTASSNNLLCSPHEVFWFIGYLILIINNRRIH